MKITILFIMPFGKKNMEKNGKNKEIDFDKKYGELKKIFTSESYYVARTDDLFQIDIYNKMYKAIHSADIAIVDVTNLNSNVMYELGARHALRDKKTILIKDDFCKKEIPFDINTFQVSSYSKFEKNYKKILESNSNDSPIKKEISSVEEDKKVFEEYFSNLEKIISEYESIPSANYGERFELLQENIKLYGSNEYLDQKLALNTYKKNEGDLKNLKFALKIIEKYNPKTSLNYELKGLACSISRKLYELTDLDKYRDKSFDYSLNFLSIFKDPYSFSSYGLHFLAEVEKKRINSKNLKLLIEILIKDYKKCESKYDSEYFVHTQNLLNALIGKPTDDYSDKNRKNSHTFLTSKKSYERAIKLWKN